MNDKLKEEKLKKYLLTIKIIGGIIILFKIINVIYFITNSLYGYVWEQGFKEIVSYHFPFVTGGALLVTTFMFENSLKPKPTNNYANQNFHNQPIQNQPNNYYNPNNQGYNNNYNNNYNNPSYNNNNNNYYN